MFTQSPIKEIKMKKTILTCAVAFTLLTAYGQDITTTAETADKPKTASFTSEETEKTGSYTVDGQTYKGKITLQKMAKDQYSVLCQQDEPFSLLQLIFTNEKEARSSATLKAGDSFYSMEPGEVHVSLSGDKDFVTTSESTGSITVSGNSVTLKDLQLINSDKKSKVVNATLSF